MAGPYTFTYEQEGILILRRPDRLAINQTSSQMLETKWEITSSDSLLVTCLRDLANSRQLAQHIFGNCHQTATISSPGDDQLRPGQAPVL